MTAMEDPYAALLNRSDSVELPEESRTPTVSPEDTSTERKHNLMNLVQGPRPPLCLQEDGHTDTVKQNQFFEASSEQNTTPKKVLESAGAKTVSSLANLDFRSLIDINNAELKEMSELADMPRFIVTLEKLKELKGDICKEMLNQKTCNSERTFFVKCGKGTVLDLSWTCANSHRGCWQLSEVLAVLRNNKIYANDILLSSSILLSGNNYLKISLLCQALKLEIPQVNAFSNVQKLYTAPVIMEFWTSMKKNC